MTTIIDVRTGNMLAKHATITRSAFGHALGLMFSTPRAMVLSFRFPAKRSIHTWFVFFPLTVLFLDSQQRMVEIATLNPFSVYIPKKEAQHIVELPGRVSGCRLGSRVRFKC